MAQAPPTWEPPFDHRNLNGAAGEVEQPPVARADWITLNTIDGRDLTNPLPLSEKFNALHASLIPVGPHRGNVLVVDGNLRNYSIPSPNQPLQRIRAKQPWAIVNPYWPGVHPYAGVVGNRFYNRALTLPVDATVVSSRDFTVFNNQYQVPSGWYMLFLVTNQGAPSDLAYWVHVA